MKNTLLRAQNLHIAISVLFMSSLTHVRLPRTQKRDLLATEYCPAETVVKKVGIRRPVEYKPQFLMILILLTVFMKPGWRILYSP